MTIRLPEQNIFDRFLKFLGKKRGVRMPIGAYEKFGHYSYVKAYKESFWKALFRSRRDELPESMIDISQIEEFRKEISESEKK
jgi:hypothetical protein